MLNQRKKPQLLMWTQTWRRLNKKGKEEGVARKKYVANIAPLLTNILERVRKVVRVQRAVVGATLEDVRPLVLALNTISWKYAS